MTSRRRVATLSAAIAAVVFLPTARNGFVMDDAYLIVDKPSNPSLRSIPGFFSGSWAAQSGVTSAVQINTNYYRPVAATLMELEYRVFGLRPAGYHLVSTALHALTTALCSLLVLRITARAGAALVGGLLFAVHPVQSEAVAAICYQTTLLAGLFGTCSLLVFGRLLDTPVSAGSGPRAGAPVGLTLALLALTLLAGCLAKEDALAVPLLAVAWALITRPPGWRRALAGGGAVMAAVLVGVLALRALLLTPSKLTFFGDSPMSTVVLTMVRVGALYVEMLIAPVRLSPFYDWFIVPFEPALSSGVLAGALALGTLGVGVALAVRGRPERRAGVAVGLAWMVLGLAPVSHVLVRIIIVAAERFLYIPMVGAALAAGTAFGLLWELAPGRRRLVAGASGVVLALLAARTAWRLPDWRDDEALNRATAAAFPETPTPLLNLGEHYRRRGDRQRAIEAVEEAARRVPGWEVPKRALERLRNP